MAKKGAAVIFTNSDGLVLIGNESQYVLDIINEYPLEIQDVVNHLSSDVKIQHDMTHNAIKKHLDKKAEQVEKELEKFFTLGYIRYTFSKKTIKGDLYITDIKYRFLPTDAIWRQFGRRVNANTVGLIKGGQGDDEDIDKTIEREIEEETGMRGPYDLVIFPFKGILRKAISEYIVYGLKLTDGQFVQINENLQTHRSGEIYNIRFENLQNILAMKCLNSMSKTILTQYENWLRRNDVSTLGHLRVEAPVKKVKRVIDPDMPPLMLPRGNTHYHGLYTISHPEPVELRRRAVILDILNDYESSTEYPIRPFRPGEKEVVLDTIVELFDKNLMTQKYFSKNLDSVVRGIRMVRFGFNSSGKRRSAKRRSAKRRSAKRRSGKRRSAKRRSAKRRSGKRLSGKRLSGKRRSVSRQKINK